MENKNTAAAQPAAQAKNAQTNKATEVAAKTQAATPAASAAQEAKPAPTAQQPSHEELIEARAEQVLRQARLVDHRHILLATKEDIVNIIEVVESSEKSDDFRTKSVRIVIEINLVEQLSITNPALVIGFMQHMGCLIDAKVADIERQLVA
jgi:hypothetical protein